MAANVSTRTVPDLDLDAEEPAPERAVPHTPTKVAGSHVGTSHQDKEHGKQPHAAEAGSGHGHKHKGHGGHDGGHEAGGHGGKWLVTYCDMITLLMAFFICILTFSSAENGKQSCPKMRDSLIYGPGGTGAVGPKEANADSVVWRQVLISANLNKLGSRTAPQHSDPKMISKDQVLDLLDNSNDAILDDSFSMRVPLELLMKDPKTLSPGGRRLLSNIAFSLRQFSFDLIVQIEDKDVFPSAYRLTKHLTELAGCPPSRAGISLVDNGVRQKNSVRFLFVTRQ